MITVIYSWNIITICTWKTFLQLLEKIFYWYHMYNNMYNNICTRFRFSTAIYLVKEKIYNLVVIYQHHIFFRKWIVNPLKIVMLVLLCLMLFSCWTQINITIMLRNKMYQWIWRYVQEKHIGKESEAYISDFIITFWNKLNMWSFNFPIFIYLISMK